MFFAAASTAHCRPFRQQIQSYGAALVTDQGTVLVVPGEAGASRARLAAEILQSTGTPYAIAQKINKRRWTVLTTNGSKIFTVTRADSKLAGRTVEILARQWAAQISRTLSQPALSVEMHERILLVPSREDRSLVIGGAARADQITIDDSGHSIATFVFDRSTRTVTVQGIKTGLVDLTVTASDGRGGSAYQNIPVLVEDRAAQIDPVTDAVVTGSPASQDLIVQAVRSAAARCIALHQGAFLEVSRQPEVDSDLSSGSSIDVPITVRAVGSDLIPVEQTITVQVHNNSDIGPISAQTLFYSNNPETVKHPQTLFNASIQSINHSVRLVFHHQNISAAAMNIRVELVNNAQTPAAVRIIRGFAPPANNPVGVGARAGIQFVREWKNNSGVILTIPGQSRLELTVIKTQPGGVASGVVEITQLAGTQRTLLLHVAAESTAASADDALASLQQTGDPSKAAFALLPLTSAYHSSINSVTSSDQIYSAPSLIVNGQYTVGGPWMHKVIGTDSPLARLTGSGGNLLGNYGVLYDINVNLTNPTAVRQQVEIAFESGAGDVSGIFSIAGGATTTINNLSPPNEQEITRISLAPGTTQKVRILTMPLSGSAYPASIIAHSL